LKAARLNCHPCSTAQEDDDDEVLPELLLLTEGIALSEEEEVTPKTWPKVRASQARKASRGLLVAGVPVTTYARW
jgi:hypothetical protein